MKPKRKSIRLENYDYSKEGLYFITICTEGRACLFGEIIEGTMCLNDLGKIVSQEWVRAGDVRDNIELDQFVVMPNHIHGIIVITSVGATRRVAQKYGPKSNSIGAIVGQFKSIVTKKAKLIQPDIKKIWQRNYYERIIRNDNELLAKRKYISENPLKWDLDPEHR